MRVAATAVIALVAAGVSAQTRPMQPEDVLGWKRISAPRVNRQGDLVVFAVRTSDLEKNRADTHLWLWSAEDDVARQFTRSGNDTHPRWLPDGRSFLFLSERSGSAQIWQMSAEGGEPRKLTGAHSGVETFAISPDGGTVAFTASRLEAPDEGEPGDDAYIYGAPRELPGLWLLDRATGEVRRGFPEGMGIQRIAWSPDGGRLAVSARPSTILDRIGETELYLVELARAEAEPRRLTENAVPESSLRFLSASELVYVAPDAERFVNAETKLFRLDLEDGAVARVASDYEYGLESPVVTERGVYLTSGVRTTRRLLRLAGGSLRALVDDPGTVLDFDVAGDGGLVYLFTDATTLPELRWRAVTGETRTIVDLNPQAAEWVLGETRVFGWRSADGLEVEGLLTLPVGYQTGEPVPLVVAIHGGPEAAETLDLAPGYLDYHQVMAGRGWAVLRPNYRGGTNYGDAFLRGMNEDTGGGDYEDIMSGVDALIAAGIADPDRLAVMGWSWGGISTGWIVTQTDRFRAASAGAMVSNHFSVFGQADLTFDVELFYIGGSPWEDPAKYLRMSPIGHVTKAVTPTLLIHGEADERCPLPQSIEFYKGLKSAGVETELVVYPREPHVFREPAHQLDKMHRELSWFESHGLK